MNAPVASSRPGLARHWYAVLIVAIAALAFVSAGPALDDAYIVYRYVARFLSGRHLTFNDHEYVEGYTGLLWTLLLALATRLTGLQVHVVSVILNLLAVVLTSLVLGRLLRILGVPRVWTCAALALMAGSALYVRVAYIGLEFALFSLVLVLFFCALFSGLRRPREASSLAFPAAGVLGGALFGIRPESILLLPLFTVILGMRGRTVAGSNLARLTIPWGLAIAAILFWRLWYYGEWLPNSVIAKSMGWSRADLSRLPAQVADGVTYLLRAYAQNPGLALVAGLTSVRFALDPRRQFEAMLLFVPIAVGHVAVVQNGGDWMPYFRFVNVFTPLYLAAFFVSIRDWLLERSRTGVVWLGVLAVVYVPTNARHFAPTATPMTTISSFGGWMDLYSHAGHALNEVWVPGDVLMAESIGMLGYAAPDIYIHDPLGLTDKHLAHDPSAQRNVYGRKNWVYSLSLNPALTLLHHWPHQRSWREFSTAYPAGYAFYYIPWSGAAPRRCLYAIVRNDRAEVYGRALQRINARQVDYVNIVFPCPLDPAAQRAGTPR